jgi:serine/threonine protein kinase
MLTSEGVDVPTLKETEHLSLEAIDFLSRCLQRRPSQRATAEELLRHPWLVQGVPLQYEHLFVKYVAAQVSDLIEDQVRLPVPPPVSGGC